MQCETINSHVKSFLSTKIFIFEIFIFSKLCPILFDFILFLFLFYLIKFFFPKNFYDEQCPNSDSETVLSQKLVKCIVCTHSPSSTARCAQARPGAPTCAPSAPVPLPALPVPLHPAPLRPAPLPAPCRDPVSRHSPSLPPVPPSHNTTCVLRYKAQAIQACCNTLSAYCNTPPGHNTVQCIAIHSFLTCHCTLLQYKPFIAIHLRPIALPTSLSLAIQFLLSQYNWAIAQFSPSTNFFFVFFFIILFLFLFFQLFPATGKY